MNRSADSPVKAVLGPTNTGKTHLAIERMCGHSSGMIGFPLRLLAREVYDRVVAQKGAASVALVTGEERIVPPAARWFLCTAESMPTDRDVGFVAIDEGQLGADPARGHVFTDRILRARGREETMILGSDALRPVLRKLVPEAEIFTRPRFSTLSYAGAKKLSRLPKRSAIVAFSAEEVYAVAEALRRLRGGAAVVMGSLSPATRNAQVAMFQAGEVDYLVATDAIGMGLNLDVDHVAFASLNKFDGRRTRRLTIAEMSQIAGRAGRHQRDGTFGALVDEGPGAFTPEEIAAIEGHRIPPLDHLFWREGVPDLSSIDALIESLERKPDLPTLRAAPEAVDLAVLRRLATEDWVRTRVRSPRAVARLWAACGLPDFRKLGADPHARFVARIFRHLSEGDGHIPHGWFADELVRLDRVDGDVETIASRIAMTRSWAYIAQRSDWLADPAHWAERTRALEARLSDALHASLTQRFVDKRTTVLLRRVGGSAADLPVQIDPDGAVSVEDQLLGRLDGFRFIVAPDARATDKRMLLAAAEKELAGELRQRGKALATADDDALTLHDDAILWRGVAVATLERTRNPVRPRVRPDRALATLDPATRAAIAERIERWIADRIAADLPDLVALDALASAADAGPRTRALAGLLVEAGGMTPRRSVGALIEALDAQDRKRLRKAGVTIGTLDIFAHGLLKPRAAAARRTLLALDDAPPEGATVLPRTATGAALTHGFRPIGAQAVRIDLVERLARAAHDARPKDKGGRTPFAPDPALAVSMGLTPDTLSRLMAQLGFRSVRAPAGQPPRWAWKGLTPLAPVKAPPRDNAFSALAELIDG
ncbi:MAG: helicase [Alphaproteobacteria bacterium HGW-Alphaproteobacteria-16]|nr:MAG: helicase [Alphaproteobacteria bacterium HGW-Alphaproteobacteria-16]